MQFKKLLRDRQAEPTRALLLAATWTWSNSSIGFRSAAGHGGARTGGDDDGAARPRAITSPSGAATRDSHAPDRQPQRCHPVVHRSDERTRVQDPRITSLSYKPGQFGADPGSSDLGASPPARYGPERAEGPAADLIRGERYQNSSARFTSDQGVHHGVCALAPKCLP
jgi:hypothetical protein